MVKKRYCGNEDLGLFLIRSMLKDWFGAKSCKFLLVKKLFKTVITIKKCVFLFTWYLFKVNLLKETTKQTSSFGTMPQEPWHPGKGAKLDCIIQLNCKKVHTHSSYKITRTWENFNNQETKMILLSGKLWLIANDSKNFANGSKSIISNLGLCKNSGIYLI